MGEWDSKVRGLIGLNFLLGGREILRWDLLAGGFLHQLFGYWFHLLSDVISLWFILLLGSCSPFVKDLINYKALQWFELCGKLPIASAYPQSSNNGHLFSMFSCWEVAYTICFGLFITRSCVGCAWGRAGWCFRGLFMLLAFGGVSETLYYVLCPQ